MLNASGPLRTRLSYSLPLGLSILLIAAVLLLSNGASFAQSTTEGAISGTVYDQQSAVVAGATITVTNNGTNQVQTTKTDSSGFFRVIGQWALSLLQLL